MRNVRGEKRLDIRTGVGCDGRRCDSKLEFVDGGDGAVLAGEVTFTKDIAPIIQRSCQNCHRSDGVAPMSLTTYEEVRPYARAIKQKTGLGPHAGVMPPWYLEKNIGIQKFQNDPVAERR